MRPDAKLDGSKPISGGIPFCFPQFGPGEIQQHGFARNVDWAIASKADGAEPSIVYELTPSDYRCAAPPEPSPRRARRLVSAPHPAHAPRPLSLSTSRARARSKGMWDQSFVATYTVTLKGDRLATNFAVKNTGGAPFSFTGALHSYWSVSSIDGIEIQGAFEGAKYLDKVAGEEKTCATKALKIGAETDAVNGSGSNRETGAVADAQPTLPSLTAPLLPRLYRCTRASAATSRSSTPAPAAS